MRERCLESEGKWEGVGERERERVGLSRVFTSWEIHGFSCLEREMKG